MTSATQEFPRTGHLPIRLVQSEQPLAIVLGLDCITGLQAARVLDAAGVKVIGVAFCDGHPLTRTRAVSGLVTVADAGESLLAGLTELGRRLAQPAVLFPCTDLSVLSVSRSREQLQTLFRFALPAAELVESLVDKSGFMRLAETSGWPIPGTRLLTSERSAREAAELLRFPCVVKPLVKDARWTAATKQKAIRVESPADPLATWSRFSDVVPRLVVSEWVPGDENWTVNGYYDSRHELVAAYTSLKLRQWPIETGTGSAAVGRPEPELVRLLSHMFDGLQFHGPVYIEAKRDPRDGRFLLIEPNIGRSTGRATMAEADGVQLLLMQYNDLSGQPLPPAQQQPADGVRWVYWRRDLRAALTLWRRGEMTLGAWWRSTRGRRVAAVFAWRDLRPFFADWVGKVKQLMFGVRRGRTANAKAVGGAVSPEGGHDASPGNVAATLR